MAMFTVNGGTSAQNASLSVFRWPIGHSKLPEIPGITSSFGESRLDHFHTGLDIAGSGTPVESPADGEVLFFQTDTHNPFQPESGAGNFLILDHGKGLWSGYYHMKSIRFQGSSVKAAAVIGESGNTGHSYGAHLHFFVTDQHGSSYLNPLKLLPKAEDSRAPVIGQMEIHTGESVTRLSWPAPQQIRLTRDYPLEISIIDPGMEPYLRRGISLLRWKVNEEPFQERSFDRISLTDKGWTVMDEKYTFNEVFKGMNYLLHGAVLRHGLNTVTVEAADFSGNKAAAVFTIEVNKEN